MELEQYARNGLQLKQYDAERHKRECLKIFSSHVPKYFAENEETDFLEYLESEVDRDRNLYFVVMDNSGTEVEGCFGMKDFCRIHWIMAKTDKGTGRYMMETARQMAEENGVQVVDIAASHLSAPFFERFGAERLNFIKDGWGKEMHRIDMKLKLTN